MLCIRMLCEIQTSNMPYAIPQITLTYTLNVLSFHKFDGTMARVFDCPCLTPISILLQTVLMCAVHKMYIFIHNLDIDVIDSVGESEPCLRGRLRKQRGNRTDTNANTSKRTNSIKRIRRRINSKNASIRSEHQFRCRFMNLFPLITMGHFAIIYNDVSCSAEQYLSSWYPHLFYQWPIPSSECVHVLLLCLLNRQQAICSKAREY